MSFSSDVKIELATQVIDKDCCALSELTALVNTSGTLSIRGKGDFAIILKFEQAPIARRTFSLVRKMFKVSPQLKRIKHPRFGGRHQYTITIDSKAAMSLLQMLNMLEQTDNAFKIISTYPKYYPKKSCCKRAFLKGVFLGAGSLQNPTKGYHLELVLQSERLSKQILRVAKSVNLDFKQVLRRNKYVLYMKKNEEISDFLAFIGAYQAVMNLEDTVITKGIFNQINRAMNCDNSNINKQMEASDKHIADINFLKSKNIDLPKKLKDVAQLRLNNPHASLEELGAKMKPPLSKSGINYRLKKISELANKYR
ncbi:MAG: DNA-binding protein WhiA [Christensenellaceae bacterium]|nr:DNA-binding protein WhiA [Christensenellaceae bacterium]